MFQLRNLPVCFWMFSRYPLDEDQVGQKNAKAIMKDVRLYAMRVPYILSTYQFPAEFEVEVEESGGKRVRMAWLVTLHKSQIFQKSSLCMVE